MIKLYMITTRDDLELPLIVEEDPRILAEKAGITYPSLLSSISHKIRGYARVIIDDEE